MDCYKVVLSTLIALLTLCPAAWGKSHRSTSRLENPCLTGDVVDDDIFDDVIVSTSVPDSYESLMHAAEHGAHLVSALKDSYFPERLQETDIEDLIMFGLRDLPAIDEVTLGDLEGADAVTIAHEIFRQLAYTTAYLHQINMDELNLEPNGGFRVEFLALENHVYSLLCHIKSVLAHHEEEVHSHVIQEVLSLPLRTPTNRAMRIVRDCVTLHYLDIATNNLHQYFTHFHTTL